jgi:hypothetical protein
MQNMIFALFGKGASGKSSTIAYVLEELLKHANDSNVHRGNRRQAGPSEVWSAVLTVQGIRVGIASPGDNEEAVRRRVEPLVAKGCQIIVCATRSGGGSVAALKQIAEEADPPFEIEWIEKVPVEVNLEQGNRTACGVIVEKVLAAVASGQLVAGLSGA